MDSKNETFRRKKNRLENYDYSTSGAYFITICTLNKRNYFWENVGATIGRPNDVELTLCGKTVEQAIKNIPNLYPSILVEQYVIMPDHVHMLLLICSDEYGRPMVAPTISRIVQQLKGYVTKQVGFPIWQKLFFDHIIRNRQDHDEHIKYICENPLNWYYDKLYTD